MSEARQISDCLPAWLVRELERVRAARNASRQNFSGPPEIGASNSPPARMAIETTSDTVMKEAGAGQAPARCNREGGQPVDLKLVSSKDGYAATTANRGRAPRPVAYLSLVLDIGAVDCGEAIHRPDLLLPRSRFV